MPEATRKASEIEDLLTSVTGVSRPTSIAQNLCVMCRCDATNFKDDLSRKEYTISGLCQECQDSIWGK